MIPDLDEVERLCRRLGPANCWTGCGGTLAAAALQMVRELRARKQENIMGGISEAEQMLAKTIEAVRDRHTKYGPPTEHFARTAALVNAAFGTTFSAADWALVMVLDKVARQRGPQATDDGGIDIAGYAACHQECRAAAGGHSP